MSAHIPVLAEIILPFAIGNSFTYSIPKEVESTISVGMRVIVPFGKKKLYAGIVYSLHNNNTHKFTIKPILSILDSESIIVPQQFKLWEWIAQYYMCSLGEVMKAALPSGLKLESETKLYANPDFTNFAELSQIEQTIISIISDNISLKISDIIRITNTSTVHSSVQSLLKKNALISTETYKERYTHKTQTRICLHGDIHSAEWIQNCIEQTKSAPKQQSFFLSLVESATKHADFSITKKQAIEDYSVSHTVIKELEKKKIIQLHEEVVSRIASDNSISYDITLHTEQKKAIQDIQLQFKNKNVCLLHGVTASGKTEIYIHLIEEALSHNKQVLYLLPEIALTSQIINRIRTAFGDKVGVYHSQLNDNERIELWNDMLAPSVDTVPIIIGARSSIFLPFTNLGLVIIDEEHEQSFKQFDPAPRYHARDTAILLASLHSAKVLLGTATPSAETYYNCLQQKYGLVELTKRYGTFSLPEISVIDLAKAYKQKRMRHHFSKDLLTLIYSNLEQNRQVLLFQNRRGYTPFITCTNCGDIPHCTNCDVSLTYHKSSHQLTCHYCGYSIPYTSTCPKCNGTYTNLKGFGTEKIEEELNNFFPNHNIARMDLDTTRGKNAYITIIEAFENHGIDILIGTQMVTKGLDFKNIGLVGILNADNLLNMPDFRTFERGFHTMIQVAGRAGRSENTGSVAIQTFNPEHEIIQDILSHKTVPFIYKELKQRQLFNYPPFVRLIRVQIKHTNKDLTEKASHFFAQLLNWDDYIQILGPEFPVITKIQKTFSMHILLKIDKQIPYTESRKKLHKTARVLHNHSDFKKVTIQFDVDPY
ncbi:MAG: primosomal protein N' [Bacteroidales bacterium]